MENDTFIIITNPTGNIIWVNDIFCQITGYRLDEVLGKKPSILHGRNTGPKVPERMSKLLKTKKPFVERVVNYKKNGAEFICAFAVHPIIDLSQIVVGFISIALDLNCLNYDKFEKIKRNYKYVNSNLDDSKEVELYHVLQDYFIKEKPYLKVDLTLDEVASALDTNRSYLSQVVNSQYGKNFRNFINEYRVREFEFLVSRSNSNRFTLFAIAEKCGFKNKSTFHTAVVNHTGNTPKQIVNRYDKKVITLG